MALPSDLSDRAACKAYFDSLPPGLHITINVQHVRALCSAAQASDGIALDFKRLLRPGNAASSANAALAMPPLPNTPEHEQFMRQLRKGEHSISEPPPELLDGFALCWDTQRTFWVSTSIKPCRRASGKVQQLQYWPDVAAMLASDVPKVLFEAKKIVNTLRRAGCHPNIQHQIAAQLPTGGLALLLGGPLADVRVAASLLSPGHAFVSDAPVESNKEEPHVEQLFHRVAHLHGWKELRGGAVALRPPSAAALALAPGQDSRMVEAKFAEQLACARRALFALALHEQLPAALAANGLTDILLRIERPLTRVIADMEFRGLAVCPQAVEGQLRALRDVRRALLDAWESTAKENGIAAPNEPVASSRQVPDLLWARMRLAPPPDAEVRFLSFLFFHLIRIVLATGSCNRSNCQPSSLVHMHVLWQDRHAERSADLYSAHAPNLLRRAPLWPRCVTGMIEGFVWCIETIQCLQRKFNGLPQTTAEVMTELLAQPDCPPVVRHIMDWRSLEKYVGFLLDIKARLPLVRPFPASQVSQAGCRVMRLEVNFMQTRIETGRIGTDEPNLQVRRRNALRRCRPPPA